MNRITKTLHADDLILQALREDIAFEDISTNAIVAEDDQCQVDLISKDTGVLCGIDIFARVFELLDPSVEIHTELQDGDFIEPGDVLGYIVGPTRVILAGERTALNFLQRMTGVATYTRSLVEILDGSKTKLLDTRKTTPNNRLFEKYATRIGGAVNHRYGLSDGVLLKDNHIRASGSVKAAVEKARAYSPFVRRVQIEVETMVQVQEALDVKADIIMLDNMDVSTCKEAIKLIGDRAITEVSGNMDVDKIRAYRDVGADFLSAGSLTHSAPIVDLSMKNLRRLG